MPRLCATFVFSTLLVVLSVSVSSAANQRKVSRILRRRCSRCHAWALEDGTGSETGTRLSRSVLARDGHVLSRLDGGEQLVLKLWALDYRRKRGGPFRGGLVSSGKAAAGRTDRGRADGSRRGRRGEVSRHSAWTDRLSPPDTTSSGVGPFTPEELGGDDPLPPREEPGCEACGRPGSISGTRARALASIALHCGRCHAWAVRPRLVLRARDRLIPKVLSGHGTRHLSRERRLLLLRAFDNGGKSAVNSGAGGL